MSDLISREYMKSLGATCIASRSKDGNMFPIVSIDELPPAEQPKERCVATITLSEEDLERIVKERVEEIKERLPRKGKWTRHFDGNEWYWYCSSCKEQWYEEDLWMGGNSFPNFCPNCGSYNGGEQTG